MASEVEEDIIDIVEEAQQKPEEAGSEDVVGGWGVGELMNETNQMNGFTR